MINSTLNADLTKIDVIILGGRGVEERVGEGRERSLIVIFHGRKLINKT